MHRKVDPFATSQTIRIGLRSNSLSRARLEFLAKLPVFLNSSLNTDKVLGVALERLLQELAADFAVILLHKQGETYSYRSLSGDPVQKSEGACCLDDYPTAKLSLSAQGTVTIADESPASVAVPLMVRGSEVFGVIVTKRRVVFSDDDIEFLEQFAHQLALALDNARLFQDVQSKNDELSAMDVRKREMITVIAHEFITPLSIIQNAAELILSDRLVQDDRTKVSTFLQNGVQRLMRLLAQVKNISLVQGEGLSLNLEVISLEEFFTEFALQYASPLEARNISFSFSVSDKGLKLEADRALLSVAIQNLISNAIRFTPDEGNIVLRAERDGDKVQVIVQDSGIGIPEEEQSAIFDSFYEVIDSFQHSSGDFGFMSAGLGLGLAVVRHILEAHGARVTVESAEGAGSRFSFILPLRP